MKLADKSFGCNLYGIDISEDMKTLAEKRNKKALGDSNRLKIIKLLTDGEQCACKLQEAFQITQPTLSHHMKILVETGLVSVRKEGKWTYYSISCCMFKE